MDAEHAANPRGHVSGYWRRHAAATARWLHIYLSMVSFGILGFFAVTGLTLNHPDAFSAGAQRRVQAKGTLPSAWVAGTNAAAVARLEIVEHLRQNHRLRGALAEFRTEDSQCSVSFRGPGYSADIFINREDGTYQLNATHSGWIAVFNDLHKGRDTGRAWSWIIDASAVLMTLVSLSGLALMLFLKRRRLTGLTAAVFGAVACWAIYVVLVP